MSDKDLINRLIDVIETMTDTDRKLFEITKTLQKEIEILLSRIEKLEINNAE